MAVYRYKYDGLREDVLQDATGGAALTISEMGTPSYIDITALPAQLEDLNIAMNEQGYAYFSTDPVDTVEEASAALISHLDLTDVGTNVHTVIDTFIASKAQASGLASLDANTRVVQTANTLWDGTAGRSASPTSGANIIPVAGAGGTISATFIPDLSATYGTAASSVTNGDAHDHSGGDGAQIDHTTLSNIGTNTHAQIDTFVASKAQASGIASLDANSRVVQPANTLFDGLGNRSAATAPAANVIPVTGAGSTIAAGFIPDISATYAIAAKGVTGGDTHDHSGGDGAQINHTTLSNIGTNTHTQIDTHIGSTSNPHSTTAAQVGAYTTGQVDTLFTNHTAAADPHPGYLTPAEANLAYAALANGVTGGDTHDHSGGDGAQINHTTLSNIGTNTHAQLDTFVASKAAVNGLASLDANTRLVQSANTLFDGSAGRSASPTSGANVIPVAGAGGTIASAFIPDLSATYAVTANGVTGGDSHDHSGGDGAQINHTTLSNIGTNTHAQLDTFVASKAQASGLASLNASSLVVQNPASATATPTSSSIVVSEAGGTIAAGWIPDLSTTYAVATKGVTNGDAHDHSGGDGAQINHTTLSNIGTNTHAQLDTFIASKAQASGLASLNASSLVVQNPASATATPSASSIVISGVGGTIAAGWIPDLSATYAVAAKGVTGGDAHDHNGGDGGTIAHTSLSAIGTNTHAQLDTFVASKAQANGLASLDAGSKVIQDPANATATPTADKIVLADGTGKIATGWIPDLSGTYATSAQGVTNGNSHDHSGGDGAQIDHTTLSNIGTNSHTAIDTFIASKAAVNGLASLNASSLVVQDPASATSTPGNDKIVKSNGLGKIDSGWVPDLSAVYAVAAKGVTGGDTHDHSGGDGNQIDHTTLSNIGTNTHAQIDTHLGSTSNPHSVTAAQVGAYTSGQVDTLFSNHTSALDPHPGYLTETEADLLYADINHIHPTPQYLTVCTSGAPGTYATVTAAMAAIGTTLPAASSTVRYVIKVQPGEYTETAPLTIKSYVYVAGHDPWNSAVLKTNDLTIDFIVCQANGGLFNIAVSGPTTAGKSTILYNGGNGTIKLYWVNIKEGSYGVTLAPTSGAMRCHAIGVVTDGPTVMNRMFNIDNPVGAAVFILMQSGPMVTTWTGTAPAAVYVNSDGGVASATAPRASATLDLCQFRGNAPSGETLYDVYADNGALVRGICCSFAGATSLTNPRVAICSGPNPGTAYKTRIDVNGSQIKTGGYTKDYRIQHADTKNTFSGVATEANLDFVANAQFIGDFADPNLGQITYGELYLGNVNVKTPVTSYINADKSTGIVFGGGLSRGAGAREVDVEAGEAFIDTANGLKKVTWGATTVTVNANQPEAYIQVDSTGTVSAVYVEPDLTAFVLLGETGTDASTILYLYDQSITLPQFRPKLYEYLENVIGPINVAGGAVTKDPSNLTFDVDSSEYYITEEPVVTAAATNATFTYWYRKNGGGWNAVQSQTAIDSTNYDDGTGTLAAITAGQFKRDLLYVSQNSGGTEFHVIYGQELFASAIAAETNPVVPDFISKHSCRLAAFVVEQGGTIIHTVVDQKPRLGQAAAGSTSVTDHGLLSGLSDDDHPQYQLRSEKGAANGYAGLDATSKVLSSVLPTVTDYTHGDQAGGTLHAIATTSVAGFMSGADKTKLDGIASGATAYTNENAQDAVATAIAAGTQTGISVTYNDVGNSFSFDAQTAGDLRYAPIAKGVTNGDTHDHSGGDGAQIDHVNLNNIGTNTHAQLDTFVASKAQASGLASLDANTRLVQSANTVFDGTAGRSASPTAGANVIPVTGAGSTLSASFLPDLSATYAVAARGVTNGDSHNHAGGDGAQIAYSDLSGLPTLGTAAAQDTTAFAPAAEGVTNGNTHDHSGGDGAQINHTTLSNIGTNTHAQLDTFVASKAQASGLASLDTNTRLVQSANTLFDGSAGRSASPTSGANIIPVASAGGTLAIGFIPDLSATYAVAAKGVTNGDTHNHAGGDGAQIAHTDLSAIGTNTHAQIDTFIASKAAVNGLASLEENGRVVQNPASVSISGAISSIPISSPVSATLDATWIPDLSATYAVAAKGVTNGDTHDHSGGDGNQINHTTLSNIGTNTHAQLDTFVASKAQASGLASLDTNSRVVQAANTLFDGTAGRSASPTPGANIIPVASAGGTIAVGFIPTLSAYALAANGVTNGDTHDHSGGDGAQISHLNLSNIGTNTHAQIDTFIASKGAVSGLASLDANTRLVQSANTVFDGTAGRSASPTATANTIPVSGADGKLDAAWLPASSGVTNGDAHDHSGGDGAQIDHTTLSNIGTNTHAQLDTFVSSKAAASGLASLDANTRLVQAANTLFDGTAGRSASPTPGADIIPVAGLGGTIASGFIPDLSATYALTAAGVTNGNTHDHSGGDGAQINHTTLSNIGTNTHAQIDTHLGAAAPHSGHEVTTAKNAANGYAGLDASSKLTGSQQVYGVAANTACQGNDSRLSDARTPTSHVLATNLALGGEHTISGATAGHVLRASSATAANFQQLAHSDLSGVGTNTHAQIDTFIGTKAAASGLASLDANTRLVQAANTVFDGTAGRSASPTAGANTIVVSGAGGTIATGWIPDLSATYALAANGVTNGNTHDHNGGDGGQIAHTSLSAIGTNTHAQIDTFIGTKAAASGLASLDASSRVVQAANLVWDGTANRSASATAGANIIPVAGAGGTIAVGFIPTLSAYALAANGVTNGDSHDHNGGDGAQISHLNLSNIGTNSHATIDTFIASKGAANGIAPLNASTVVPVANLATGTPDGTKFLRDDGTWAAPPGASGGEANTMSNLGAGAQIYATKVGVDLRVRSLIADDGFTFTQNTNDITLTQKRQTYTITAATGTTTMPITAPISTSGTEVWTGSFTLLNSAHRARIELSTTIFGGANSSNLGATWALFRGTTLLATGHTYGHHHGASQYTGGAVNIDFEDAPGTVGPHTYSIRVGSNAAGSWYFGRNYNTPFAASSAMRVSITEVGNV